MDRAVKDDLAKLIGGFDAAVIVATHDPEFAAAFAERVVLLADGRVIADGPTAEVLCGGTYFATETARILGGAGGALLPADGVALLRPSGVQVTGMSWQLGAFAMLAAGLLAGFAWYERTRPDARIVALVGTLAAFAALGRIAFAAVPNVKPTTDIVLIAGYALGGAPGYVVGAVAALTSNFFFGQGPWTPWQMAGLGLTGIAGALLARVTRGRIGRLPLALVCFVLGFAFTALQDVGDWVTYSDHSLAQLGVYVGKGLGFDLDLRHAAASGSRCVRPGADPHAAAVQDAAAGHLAAAGRGRDGCGGCSRAMGSSSGSAESSAARARFGRRRHASPVDLPARGPEPRRRLRHGAGPAVRPAGIGLGDAGAWRRAGRSASIPAGREGVSTTCVATVRQREGAGAIERTILAASGRLRRQS